MLSSFRAACKAALVSNAVEPPPGPCLAAVSFAKPLPTPFAKPLPTPFTLAISIPFALATITQPVPQPAAVPLATA